ncbi:MAG: hypothetical protein IT380_17485 [Myxococcales bacterium]|nr:hypothetical protein [Myxococcales bacterium]
MSVHLGVVLLAALGQAPDAPTASTLSPQEDASTPAPPPAAPAAPAVAVGPAPAPTGKEEEYGLFPLWNAKLRAKGIELPKPFGVSLNYYYQEMGVALSNLKLGFNDNPPQDVGLIEFGTSVARAHSLSIRPNFMVLPFFSVYGVAAVGTSQTTVNITGPVAFQTTAKSTAFVLSLGGTLQGGYKGFFGVADFNFSVADVDRLADLMGANLLSLRAGYTIKLGKRFSMALWAGASGVMVGVGTRGSVKLAEVLPAPTQEQVDAVNAKCAEYRPNDPRKEPCTNLAAGFQGWADGTQPPTASVSYSLDKNPTQPWNMLVGAQFAYGRDWMFRAEGGFLSSRLTFMASLEYRFDVL